MSTDYEPKKISMEKHSEIKNLRTESKWSGSWRFTEQAAQLKFILNLKNEENLIGFEYVPEGN